VGQGQPLADTILQDIANKVNAIRKVLDKKKMDREELDREAFEVIHRGLPQDPDILGDMRFWARFATLFLFDVVVWRFPGRGEGGFNIENLGLSSSARGQAGNYVYNLWIRGELSRVARARDPYRLGRVGTIDFWTSHVHRQGFSKSRDFAREFIQFQYPEEMKGRPRLWAGEENKGTGRFGVRTLVKRVRRMWATIEYGLLESAEHQKLLREMARGLKGADGKSVLT
jgi:hypothetical protein